MSDISRKLFIFKGFVIFITTEVVNSTSMTKLALFSSLQFRMQILLYTYILCYKEVYIKGHSLIQTAIISKSLHTIRMFIL
jgi:hypothetical protein